MSLARRLKALFAPQPRIAGVRRERANTALVPKVAALVEARARSEGKSRSRVEAEIISRALGYDAATGDRLKPTRYVLARPTTPIRIRTKGTR